MSHQITVYKVSKLFPSNTAFGYLIMLILTSINNITVANFTLHKVSGWVQNYRSRSDFVDVNVKGEVGSEDMVWWFKSQGST